MTIISGGRFLISSFTFSAPPSKNLTWLRKQSISWHQLWRKSRAANQTCYSGVLGLIKVILFFCAFIQKSLRFCRAVGLIRHILRSWLQFEQRDKREGNVERPHARPSRLRNLFEAKPDQGSPDFSNCECIIRIYQAALVSRMECSAGHYMQDQFRTL
jgi:hypothetical protein